MITVVVGPPCAGKSTRVQEEATRGDVIVDFDLIAKALGADGHRPDGPIKEAAFAARQAVIDVILSGINGSSWIIHTSPTPRQVRAYREVDARFILVDPGIDVCKERAVADERPEGTASSIEAWYESPPVLELDDEPSTEAAFSTPKGGALMQTKSVPVTFKTGPEEGLEEGEFIAYASTFTREPDSYGDVVAKGAFARGITERKEKNIPLPGLFGHRLDDPDFYVATALEESEDDHGWRIKGRFDMESPKGPHVYRLVKDGRLRELSFAFQVIDSAHVTLDDGTKANELRDLDVFEFSFVPIGANRSTSVEQVKSPPTFTGEEIAALKEVAAQKFASEEEEVAAKSKRDEELLRAKEKVINRYRALMGEEGDSK